MPPSIDDNAPLGPSQSRGTVDSRDGSTTVAITAEEAAKIEHLTMGEIVFFQSLIVSQLFTEGMMEDPISLFIPILFCIVAFPLLYRCISTFDTLHFDFDTSILVRKRNPYWSELGDS